MREVNQYENERHQANERMEESHRRIKRLEREVEDCKVNLIQNAFNFCRMMVLHYNKQCQIWNKIKSWHKSKLEAQPLVMRHT
jgi:hypothetical protein